tara:strand:- start:270 stop:953 length:684 start_codon:yes stop_codon:yes gene_type:complete
MNLNKLLFTALLAFLFSPAISQSFNGRNLADHMLIKIMDKSLYKQEYPVDGSPYLNPEFTEGEVYTSKGNYSEVPLRYNIDTDVIEFSQDEAVYALDPEPRIKKVVIGENVFVVEKGEIIGKMNNSFYLRLDSGKAQLLMKKAVSFREAQPAQAMQAASTPARYQKMPDQYFYKIGDGGVMKIGSIKKLIEEFPDKQEELSAFAKKEKISPKNERELISFFQYYNSL